QTGRQPQAPRLAPDGDLPDEQVLPVAGSEISRGPADDLAGSLGHSAGRGKMRAPEGIAVERVVIHRRLACDEPVDLRRISWHRPPDGGRGCRCSRSFDSRLIDMLHHLASVGFGGSDVSIVEAYVKAEASHAARSDARMNP